MSILLTCLASEGIRIILLTYKIFQARSKNISFHVGHHLVSLRQALGPVLHHLVHEADAERLVGCEERAQLQRQLGLPLAYRVQHRVLDNSLLLWGAR